ncbi:MAG: type IV toxin-antitoxin system AbiEi family antitoxin domain-containing protein [Solirubrobacterales bacterium]|nr:type IV toxin-antitoxin system AbiEi family antitoxin domain-containing protein [Solirubrobacterales bacterium]
MHAVERAIARVARRQDNVITHDQLFEAGLGRGAIARRLAAGTMQQLHRGVYLLGAAPPTHMARTRAAVMACGDGAVVSHRSAAEMFGLLPETDGEVDVTVVGRNPGFHSGVRLHRPRHLARHDVTKMRGIPMTTVARTICDLAASVSARDTERAFQEALYRRIVTTTGLGDILKREPRRKGAAVIRTLLEDPRMTRSEKERALLKLLDQAQLPRPLTNVRLHGHLVDAYWPEQRLVLEFDGWQAHGHRHAFERDRRFDQVMLANGLRPLRVTDRQFVGEPFAIVARIAQSLRA